MTPKLLIILLEILLSQSLYANTCLLFGDSQMAHSLEKKSGFAPALKKEFEKRGYLTSMIAIKGVGAQDWLFNKKGQLIGKDQTKESFSPFQDSPIPITLTTEENSPPFLTQVIKAHKEEDLECVMIQLGDADLFKKDSAKKVIELVREIRKEVPNLKHCGIIPPTYKGKGEKDEFPYIRDRNKISYTTQVRYHLQVENLQSVCPLLDTLNEDFLAKWESQQDSLTRDGLIVNKQGGELWAREVLEIHPIL